MAQITVNKLTFQYDSYGEDIFKDVSFFNYKDIMILQKLWKSPV